MKRESGYYWVKNTKPTTRHDKDEWELRYWDGQSWHISIDTDPVEDNFFEEIDERRIGRRTNPSFEVIPDPLPTILVRTGKPK